MKELIDRAIDIALLRETHKFTILRLDEETYRGLSAECMRFAVTTFTKLTYYRGLSIRIERESWTNKVYIEIE